MTVQNIQELYLMIVGFQFYGMIWSIFVETGLIALPFIGYFWSGWLEEYRRHGGKVVLASRRKLTFDVVLGVMALTLFYAPIVSLGITDIQVRPLQGTFSSQEELERSKELADSVRGSASAQVVKVPVLFSFFYNLSTGVMYAGVVGVSEIEANIKNLRELETLRYSGVISDPILYAEIRRFTNECYIPAKNKYQRLYATNPANFMKEILEKRPDDLNWIGSRVLLATQGLYARCENVNACGDGSHGFQAQEPVPGFIYFSERDAIFRDNQGHPYCNEWWLGESAQSGVGASDSDEGLRSRMIEYARTERQCHGIKADISGTSNCSLEDQFQRLKDIIGSIMAEVGIFGVDELGREAEDAALRHFLRNTADSVFVPSPYAEDSTVRNAFGYFGSGSKLIEARTTMQVVKVSLPIIQTVLVLLVIVILPLYGVLSGFSFQKAFVPIVAIGFIKFLAVWWVFVSMIDNKVLDLMGMGSAWSAAFNPIGHGGLEGSVQVFMWSIIVLSMYVAIPIIGGALLQNAGDLTNGMAALGSTGVNKSGGGDANAAGNEASNTQSDAIGAATPKTKNPVKSTNVKI